MFGIFADGQSRQLEADVVSEFIDRLRRGLRIAFGSKGAI